MKKIKALVLTACVAIGAIGVGMVPASPVSAYCSLGTSNSSVAMVNCNDYYFKHRAMGWCMRWGVGSWQYGPWATVNQWSRAYCNGGYFTSHTYQQIQA